MGRDRITEILMFYHWDIIGHEKVLASLESDFLNKNIHHAYLFVGPEKIGKFRTAKTAAAILQCPNDLCNSCDTCSQVEKKCHPDTIELEDNGESIKINEIREIIARLNMTGSSKYKILLIENIGRLTSEAANCLLKILEEPPPQTIFIFTAAQLRDVMPTIASRMRTIHFRKLPDAVLKQALRERYPDADEETLSQVLLLSLGRSGQAIKLLSSPEKFQEVRELYRHIQFLDEKASSSTRMIAMQKLIQNPERMKLFLSLLVHYLRRKGYAPHNIRVIEEVHRIIDLLERNVNPRLLLEHLMIQL